MRRIFAVLVVAAVAVATSLGPVSAQPELPPGPDAVPQWCFLTETHNWHFCGWAPEPAWVWVPGWGWIPDDWCWTPWNGWYACGHPHPWVPGSTG